MLKKMVCSGLALAALFGITAYAAADGAGEQTMRIKTGAERSAGAETPAKETEKMYFAEMSAAASERKAAEEKAEKMSGRGESALSDSYPAEAFGLPEDAELLVTVEGEGLNAVVSAFVREPLNAAEETSETAGSETAQGGSGRTARKLGPGEFLEEGAAKTGTADMETSGEAAQTGDHENGMTGGSSARTWRRVLCTAEGKLGRKGLGKEREGDEKTPVGLFRMNTPFGIAPREDGFPENYLQVDERYYWDGDSGSSRYNRLVNTDEYNVFDKNASEHLIRYAGYYNYCIDTGYNPDGVPGKGSALFLHCSMGENTGGCIAVPEAEMIEIMKLYREGKTWISIAPKGEMTP